MSWYARLHATQINMNAYKYQKLRVRLDSIHLFEYPLLISDTYVHEPHHQTVDWCEIPF